jgi:hypothetical protein
MVQDARAAPDMRCYVGIGGPAILLRCVDIRAKDTRTS